jgi:very-short-patch-repair endonuclease
VITRVQLLGLGFTRKAIEWRLQSGRLREIHRGVYAVAPQLTREGGVIAAVLACGPGAVLSHGAAAAHWGIQPARHPAPEVSVPAKANPRRREIRVHRRANLMEVTKHHGIPVTTPAATLVDLAPGLSRDRIEAAVNQADALGLTDPERLRRDLDIMSPRPGLKKLRTTLDRRTCSFTRSGLERHFLRICRRAGLPTPLTAQWVNGFEVDFYWPDLGLVVETDSLTYHRTPAQQMSDRVRDQTHTAAGLTQLRLAQAQIRFEPGGVTELLSQATRRAGSATSAS